MEERRAVVGVERLGGLLILLGSMALGSPLVEPVPGRSSGLFWLGQAAGLASALAALLRPAWQARALGVVLVAQVFLPAALQIHYRAWDGPTGFCHDSVLQFEIALRDLRAGVNPYTRDYTGTPLEQWKGWSENPALHHFVYPPLVLLASAPVEAASRMLLPRLPDRVPQLAERFYDQRLVLLGCFAALACVTWRLLREHPLRVPLAALVLLNPWFAPFVVEGRNDVALLLPLAGAALAWRRGRPVFADLLLGVAVAAKTLLLPAVPFLLLARRDGRLRAAALLIAPLALTSLPFLLWDARGFLDDVVLAPAGHGSHPFEIRGWGGYGFANLVLALGLASSPQAAFPFLPFQLAAYAAVAWKARPALRVDADAATALLWGLGGVLAVLFFGRFIHDNYVGTLLSAAVIAAAWTGTPSTSPGTSART